MLQGLYKQLVETFKGLGVEAVPGVGEPFDPEFHDAIMKEPNDDVPDGTVLQEFRKGFRIGGTLLRPGMVKVRCPFVNASCTNLVYTAAWECRIMPSVSACGQ